MKLPGKNLVMAIDLLDLVHIHENALEDSICDELISFFEEKSEFHERLDQNGRPNFTQFNLTQNKTKKEKIHNNLIKNVFSYRDKYYNFVCSDVFPTEHAFEEFRIKKYNPGGEDRFDTHVDVKNYSSARRFLSFMWYLNDVTEGGETVFEDLIIKPKKGTLLIFPPLWMFPHRGNIPINGPKYLLSTYLHYK
jgi:prolyl 4-hydroxylase